MNFSVRDRNSFFTRCYLNDGKHRRNESESANLKHEGVVKAIC